LVAGVQDALTIVTADTAIVAGVVAPARVSAGAAVFVSALSDSLPVIRIL
jgi:hypothetical protein